MNATSAADDAAVNPINLNTLLANGLSTFFIKGKTVFSNGTKRLSSNSPHCPILCSWVFDNSILAEELFAKLDEVLKLVY